MDARLPEANVDLCRLAHDSRSVTCQEASKTCVGKTVEARPVGVPPDGGHWACQVPDHADDLQPRGSRGRGPPSAASAKPVESLRKKVNPRMGIISVFAFITYIGQSAHHITGVMWGGNQKTD